MSSVTGSLNELSHHKIIEEDILFKEYQDINKLSKVCKTKYLSVCIGFAIWRTPKRSKTKPGGKTLAATRADGTDITVAAIPIYIDEGMEGDINYLQPDTIYMLNHYNVHVIITYYSSAEKSRKKNNKLTSQKLDQKDFEKQLTNLINSNMDPVEWNRFQMSPDNLVRLGEKAKESYKNISNKTGVKTREPKHIDKFINTISQDAEVFESISRKKSIRSQKGETKIEHKQEAISKGKKATITIIDKKNGGLFPLTCDEIYYSNEILNIVESKHTKRGKLPGKEDINDGIYKIKLFASMEDVRYENSPCKHLATLKLTSSKIIGSITLPCEEEHLNEFILKNNLSRNKKFLHGLNMESLLDRFQVLIENSKSTEELEAER